MARLSHGKLTLPLVNLTRVTYLHILYLMLLTGTSIMLVIRDSTGATASSASFTINEGDSSCMTSELTINTPWVIDSMYWCDDLLWDVSVQTPLNANQPWSPGMEELVWLFWYSFFFGIFWGCPFASGPYFVVGTKLYRHHTSLKSFTMSRPIITEVIYWPKCLAGKY